MTVRKAATELLELARERVGEITTTSKPPATIANMLMRAYLQGALDGSAIEHRRANFNRGKRGPYGKRGAA